MYVTIAFFLDLSQHQSLRKKSAWHIYEDLDIQVMKANSPMRTLVELTVAEVFPFMFFPSSIERSEMESSDGSLIYSRIPTMESSGNAVGNQHQRMDKNLEQD